MDSDKVKCVSCEVPLEYPFLYDIGGVRYCGICRCKVCKKCGYQNSRIMQHYCGSIIVLDKKSNTYICVNSSFMS